MTFLSAVDLWFLSSIGAQTQAEGAKASKNVECLALLHVAFTFTPWSMRKLNLESFAKVLYTLHQPIIIN